MLSLMLGGLLVLRGSGKPPNPQSGKYFWPINPRKNAPDVYFLDEDYYNGVREHRGSGWVVPPGYWHTGVDLNGPGGGNSDYGQPIHAMTDGVVVEARVFGGSWGRVVVIWHPGPRVWTRSAHLSRIDVKPGQAVQAGQQIGLMGAMPTGGFAHLHFDVIYRQPPSWEYFPRWADKSDITRYFVDPIAFLQKNGAQNPPLWEREA